MQCCLSGVQIIEVPTFLAETPSERSHAIELVNPFDIAHMLIIPVKLSGVINYFDVFSPTIAEYESEEIPKILFTAEKLPWDPSRNEYSEQET